MIKKTLSVYWRVMRPNKQLWLASIILSALFFVGMDILQPWLISRFIGDLSNISGKTVSSLSRFVWLWAFARIVVFLLGRVQIRMHFKVMTRALRDLDLLSFKTTLSHSSDFFANNFTGSIVTKFNRFTRSFDVLANALMFDITSLTVKLIFPFLILMFIAPIIGIILFIWATLFITILVKLHAKKIPRSREVSAYDSMATGVVADTVTNAMSVKMFASFTHEYQSFEKLSQDRMLVRYKNLLFGDYIRMYKTISMTTLEVLVFYFSIKSVVQGSLSVSGVLLIQLYIQQLMVSLWDFGKLVEKLEEAMADATEMTEIYEQEPSVKDVPDPISFENIKGHIQMKDVSFSYESDDNQSVFEKLNIDIPIGQKVGFVGPSGGGKTTLTKLLLRFMDIDSGQIMIDGNDISKVAQDDLRRNIAYVPQEPLLFHRSIYENINYGSPDASHDDVMTASRLAHADEFIDKLSHGYDTTVGERGVKLSGGQKQRVAIARAMLKKSPILILDEATSALDSKSEKLITNALNNLMQDRTTIVIAHRLSTIKKLDRIIVLAENGAIEDGTHEDLLKLEGIYAELWYHQHDDFI